MDFKNAAKQACETKFENANSTYPLITEDRLPYVCMDLTYQYMLLVEGFGRFAMTLGYVVMLELITKFFSEKCQQLYLLPALIASICWQA